MRLSTYFLMVVLCLVVAALILVLSDLPEGVLQ